MAAVKLGDIAPDFEVDTSVGPLRFHDWLGSSWGVLFSHPADNTPVCTTELAAAARYAPEFAKRSTKVIALSVDGVESHKKWVRDIEEVGNVRVEFPIIADEERKVSKLYGMLGEQDDLSAEQQPKMPLTVRNVYIIDPSKKIRLILIYPASCGRNFDEIVRVLDSLQLTTYQKVTTPANWERGKDVIISPAINNEDAAKLFGDFVTVTPYLRTTADPTAPLVIKKKKKKKDKDPKEDKKGDKKAKKGSKKEDKKDKKKKNKK